MEDFQKWNKNDKDVATEAIKNAMERVEAEELIDRAAEILDRIEKRAEAFKNEHKGLLVPGST